MAIRKTSEHSVLIRMIARELDLNFRTARALYREIVRCSVSARGCMTNLEDHVFKLRLEARDPYVEVFQVFRQDAWGIVGVHPALGRCLLDFSLSPDSAKRFVSRRNF